jgi:hypothetical protein
MTQDMTPVSVDDPMLFGRLYPLARAISRSRDFGEIREYSALIQEDHYRGFQFGNSRTVGQWLAGQEVARYNRNNDKFMSLFVRHGYVGPRERT